MAETAELAGLLSWDTSSGFADESYTRLRAHPRYPEAVRRFASNMLAAGDADPVLDGILKDAGRNAAALFAATLHFSGELTLPGIKALCLSLGLISAGRARALLLYLIYLGYVKPAPLRRRGPALYTATAKFVETWRRHQGIVLGSIAVLEPAAGLLLERIGMPGVLEGLTRFQSEGFLASAPTVEKDAPYFRVFMHSHAGIQIVHSLLAASREEVFPPMEPIAFSAAAAAKRFRVSRVHVGRVLAAAEAAGLLRLCPGGAVTLEPAGRAAVDFVFAMQLLHFLAAAARTLKGLPALSGDSHP